MQLTRGIGILALAMLMVLLKGCPTGPIEEPPGSQETATSDNVKELVNNVPEAGPEKGAPEPSAEKPGGDKGTAQLHPLMKEVDGKKYEKDLAFIAKPRIPGSPHWKAVQDLCASRFKELGFEVELHKYKTGVNVIGVKKGTKTPEERVLISAHYDSVSNCDGADDNASGTAGVLEAARVLAKQDHDRTLVVACWDEEESGLIGSIAYATRVIANKEKLKMHFVLEMIGYYSDQPNSQTLPTGLDLLYPDQSKAVQTNQNRGDFVALIGDTGAEPSAKLMSQYGEALGLNSIILTVPDALKTSPLIRDLRRSDHAPFWSVDIPAMMITDTSEFRYKPYHCRGGLKDTLEKLNTPFTTQIIQVTVGAAVAALNPTP